VTNVVGVLRAAVPALAEPDEARELLERELSDPAYDPAEPTLLDRAARAVQDFFAGLFDPQVPDGWGPTAALVAAIVVAVVVVGALLIWGRPRRIARAAAASTTLFGEDERRTAAQLRTDAEAAAREERWDAAVILRFRALARALTERSLVDPAPGATAQSFAREAARPFPGSSDRFAEAAGVFDDVRYLRRPGSAALYRDLVGLDDDIARARPLLAGIAP
jgi:hypothetical protein